jgi:hypothetical protein
MKTMYLYALATLGGPDDNTFKVGESRNLKGVTKRHEEYDNRIEPIFVRAVWLLDDNMKKNCDKIIHRHYKDKMPRKNREWVRGVSLEELDETINYIFGPIVKRIQ